MHEIEGELVAEQRRHQDTLKELNKAHRHVKDLGFQSEEDKKIQQKLQKHVEKLEGKMKTMRRQIDETEEVAALNLHKYRNAQQELEAAYERADVAESTVNKFRSTRRAESQAPRDEVCNGNYFFPPLWVALSS